MAWNPAIERLRDVLATIYPSEDDARLVATQAQLPLQFIEFDGAAIHIWTNLLTIADRSNAIAAVIQVAQTQFPQNPALADAIRAYEQSVQTAPTAASPEAPPVPALPPKPGPAVPIPAWAWAVIGGVTVIALLLVPYLFGIGDATPTPTPAQPMPSPTATPTVLPTSPPAISDILDQPSLTSADIARVTAFLDDTAVPAEAKQIAIGALGKLGWNNVVPLLQEIIDTSNDTAIKETAITALGGIGTPSARGALLALLEPTYAQNVRTKALRALATLTSSSIIIEAIRGVLKYDPDPVVRSVAVEVLGNIKALAAVDDIIFVLKSDQEIVRIQAARTLVVFAKVAAVPPALRYAARFGTDNARVAAIESLVSLQDGEAIAIFEELSQTEESTLVRQAAQAAYEQSQSWSPTTGTPVAVAQATATPNPSPTPTLILQEGVTGRSSQTLTVYIAPNQPERAEEYPAGTIVTYIASDVSNEWAYVSLADDKAGWIPVSAVNWARTGQSTTRQPGSRSKLWPNGSTIKIAFLDGEPELQEMVAKIAKEWTDYANLTFAFIEEPAEAAVRISFEQPGAWSYVGTDALTIPKDKPTMNIGRQMIDTDEAQRRNVVLREFGHMLGLLNEISNPNRTIPWDEEALYNYYRETFGWGKAEVERYILVTWDPMTSINKAFDPDSVMMNTISNELTIGDYEIGVNSSLSEQDKAFISMLYPYPRATQTAEASILDTPTPESIDDLGVDEPAAELAAAVGQLEVVTSDGRRRPLCTAFVVSDDYVLTADYCATAYGDRADAFILRLGYWSADEAGEEYTLETTPAELNEALGYALLRVADGAPASDFAAIPLQSRAPVINEAAIMIFHYEGKPLAVSRTDCAIREPPTDTAQEQEFYHTCDRGGGSGGAPILAASDFRLLGLHHSSTAQKGISMARRMDAISAQSTILQSLANNR